MDKFVPMARSSMTTGRIRKAIDEIGEFNWDVIAKIVDEALVEHAEAANLQLDLVTKCNCPNPCNAQGCLLKELERTRLQNEKLCAEVERLQLHISGSVNADIKRDNELHSLELQVENLKDKYETCEQCDGSADAGVLCVPCWNRVNLQVRELLGALKECVCELGSAGRYDSRTCRTACEVILKADGRLSD